MATKKRRRRKRKYHRKGTFKLSLRKETMYTIIAVFFFALSGIVFLSLIRPNSPILGETADVVSLWFGPLAIILPFLLISIGSLFFRLKTPIARPNVSLGLFLVFLSLLAMAKSGQVGELLWDNVLFLISDLGAWLLFFGSLVIGISILLNTSIDEIAIFFVQSGSSIYNMVAGSLWNTNKEKKPNQPTFPTQAGEKSDGKKIEPVITNVAPPINEAKPAKGGKGSAQLAGLAQSTVINNPGQEYTWEYPPVSLLTESESTEADAGDIKHNATTIEQTLDSFGIKARVMEVNLGPAVTQYALEIALGTKLSKITSLSNDLALALAAPTGQIRIEAPIPGRRLVGVEVPNNSLRIVTLKEMLLSEEIRKESGKLSIPLGLDVSGKPLIGDLTKMPHVLIAGTTGSGKSVMMNSIITSILFRTTPAEVRMILVDPKRVEMTVYNDIPHLLTPVIHEADQTLSALKWALGEMDRRYKIFAAEGARNIASYNEQKGFQAIPYIIIVVDELADLMMFAAAEVEDSITRIAQMARATGIHLVISTQRPSVNVITGLIKANIPTRISFNVSSMVDSRVILDSPGAEKLLGRGDMLYVPPTQSKPMRIQGTYVDEKEVKELVKFLKIQVKNQGIPIEYTEEVTKQQVTLTKSTGLMETTEGKDPLFEDAKRCVMSYDRASASLLQRRLKIGYARAARVLDQLEEVGIVGPAEGSKPREVLIKVDQMSPDEI